MRSLAWTLMAVCAVSPCLADGEDPEAEDAVRKGLADERRYAEVGRRITALERDYAAAGDDEWIPKAVLLVELADLQDRRAVTGLARALADEEAMVVAFALHGLGRQLEADIRLGGGSLLFDGLVEHVGSKSPFLRARSQRVLETLTGQALGKKERSWRKWLKKHPDALATEDAGVPFDESAHDPELVARVRTQGSAAGTSVRPRIPSVTSEIRELNERGLDVVLCLDQTGSMGPVLEEAKANLESLIGVIEQVVKDHRIGFVTYHDAAAMRVPLRRDLRELRETLQRVAPFGGGDMPEGIDKALDVALTPDFGWRRDTLKSLVIVGDAPMHAADVQPTMQRVAAMHTELGMVFNTVSTGAEEVTELKDLAAAGGGRSLLLEQTDKLVGEILLLIFGEPLRPAMERFVPVLLEILQAAKVR